jgi:hypothetical protein
MPIFDNKITFIHIPKCGGTSIEKFLLDNGYSISLFSPEGSIFINGHTPQHCTYKELKELNLLTDKIFTVIRPEIERVVSEYFYVLEWRPEVKKLFNGFDEFLDLFLDEKNYLLFDNHNKECKKFITDENGYIDKRIKVFNFFDIEGIENFLGIKGLDEYHHLKTDKKNFSLSDRQIQRIKDFYGDSIWL